MWGITYVCQRRVFDREILRYDIVQCLPVTYQNDSRRHMRSSSEQLQRWPKWHAMILSQMLPALCAFLR